MVDKPFLDLITPPEYRPVADGLRRKAQGGLTSQTVSRRRRKDGTLVDVEIWVVPPVIGKDLVGMFMLYEDVTERIWGEMQLREAKDTAEAANRAKSEFLANMSHEIRTPLNGVLGMLDVTLDLELGDETRENLEIAQISADSLLGVINDILDFSKIEAGKVVLDNVEFHITDVLGQVVRTFRQRIAEKGLRLDLSVDYAVPERVVGDPFRLRQILVNLIGNGLKFTKWGEIRIVVTGERLPHGIELHFPVSDTGIGISKEKRQSIFAAFAQADGSTTRRYGGTGLGLSISSGLVALMGGRIWVESEVGRGSTFHFTALLREPKDSGGEFPELLVQSGHGKGNWPLKAAIPSPCTG